MLVPCTKRHHQWPSWSPGWRDFDPRATTWGWSDTTASSHLCQTKICKDLKDLRSKGCVRMCQDVSSTHALLHCTTFHQSLKGREPIVLQTNSQSDAISDHKLIYDLFSLASLPIVAKAKGKDLGWALAFLPKAKGKEAKGSLLPSCIPLHPSGPRTWQRGLTGIRREGEIWSMSQKRQDEHGCFLRSFWLTKTASATAPP